MKKANSQKLILTATLALASLVATGAIAYGATIDQTTSSAEIATDQSVAVSVNYANPETDQQATLIVIPSDKSLANFASADIKYITQGEVTNGAYATSFELAEGDRSGTYTVYVGGTGVDAPWSKNVSFVTGHNITGSFTLAEGASFSDATAVATPVSGSAVNGNVNADGAYTITVNPATYNVTVGKPGYIYRTYANVAVTNADVSLGSFALYGGDLDGTGAVNSSDLGSLLTAYGKNETTDVDTWETIKSYDMDGSGAVNASDLSILLASYGKGYTD